MKQIQGVAYVKLRNKSTWNKTKTHQNICKVILNKTIVNLNNKKSLERIV